MTDQRIVDFRDALRADDAGESIDGFDGFDAAVDEQAKRESVLRDVARGIIARVPPAQPLHQTAQQYLQAVADAQETRLKAKYDFALYLEDGPSADAVADRVDAVIETTDAVEQVGTELRESGGDIDLPPALGVVGPNAITVPKGGFIHAEYTATNLGTTSVSDVEVSLDGYDLSANPTTIDSLASGANAAVIVSGPADETAEAPLVVSVGSAVARTDLRIIDKAGYLERALAVLEDVANRVNDVAESDDGNKNGGKPDLKGLQNKIKTVRKRIEKLADDVESGKRKGVDKRIRAIINLVGAFINQVHGLGNEQLSDRNESILSSDAAAVIDELAAATEAEV